MNSSDSAERTPQIRFAIPLSLWAAAIAIAPSFAARAILVSPALLLTLSFWTLAKPGRWITLFLASALLLPPLPIPIGDSGPHPCLLFAGLGLLAGVVRLGEWRTTL